jgi:hypothetical protein
MAAQFPKIGAQSRCPPKKIPDAKVGAIDWAWWPDFSWLKVILYTFVFVTFLGLLMLVVGALGGGNGILAFGVIFFLFGLVAVFLFGNWKWNSDKQFAYSTVRWKRMQALELWKKIDPICAFRAKDLFFETRYGGKTLKVLRDGTIEVHGVHCTIGTTGEMGDVMMDGMGDATGSVGGSGASGDVEQPTPA